MWSGPNASVGPRGDSFPGLSQCSEVTRISCLRPFYLQSQGQPHTFFMAPTVSTVSDATVTQGPSMALNLPADLLAALIPAAAFIPVCHVTH